MESDLNDRANEQNYENMKTLENYRNAQLRGEEINYEAVERAFESKPAESYPENVEREMAILCVDKQENAVHPIGSLSYRGTKYAGDYDFFEKIDKGSLEKTIKFFVENLRRMVREYVKLKDHYFMEIKCGIDARFAVNVGVCQNGVYYVDPDLMNTTTALYKQKLLTLVEFNMVKKIVNNNGQLQIDYENIQKMFRTHRVLRWTAEEIIAGQRKIPFGIKTLEEACQDKEKINIETIAIINNKISDVSNFFYLTYTIDGKEYAINFDQSQIDDPNSFEQGLLESVNMLLYSKNDFNPLKAIKRFFSLAKNTGDMNLRTKLQPFMNSETLELGKIKSELMTISKTLTKYGNKVSQNIVISQMDDIKFRMASLLQLSDEMLTEFNKKIDDVDIRYTPKKAIEFCDDIAHALLPMINENAMNFLTESGLYPTPREYTPLKPQYKII